VGTTFTLYLPRAAGAVPSAAPIVVDADLTDLPARRILLVEDNEGVGHFARELLTELGQTVTWAGDAQAALYMLEDRHEVFDLVFSDVVMPGMSGVELAQQIARRWPRLDVILTSGYSHILVEEGAHGFPLLKKPYSIDGLVSVLRKTIKA
jgi:CheY-like chemotaxis protein